ncbi:MAG TPA: acyl-CoA dehydrogenase family protein [Solirubrobacteraceae bacterium]|nr:acyl-CoA dehydrogenase family protein [Solirubrobacteraceae bacterium]
MRGPIGDAAIAPRPAPLDDEQRALKRSVAEFARGTLNAGLERRDRDAVFPRELWRRCAEMGIQGLPVPPQYGGLGASATTIAAALQGLGYGCEDNGLIFSLNAQMWACETPLVHFGSEEQKRRYLPAMCDGSLVAAHAMSEPGSGSDAFSLTTTAARTDGRWVLNGSKTFATNAPDSDLFLVFATSDRSLGFAGLCAFIVERGAPGLEIGAPYSKMGLRSSHLGELFLTDCELPDSALLGTPGAGMAIFNHSMRWERSLILAAAVGTMERQLEQAIGYARERRQFGRPIAGFQAVSHKLVEMKLRLETAHLMLYRIAALLDDGSATDLDAAMTKLHLSECLVQSSLDAMQVFGGAGYMTETGLERQLRDALASRLYSGTSEMQRNVIAGHLGL